MLELPVAAGVAAVSVGEASWASADDERSANAARAREVKRMLEARRMEEKKARAASLVGGR